MAVLLHALGLGGDPRASAHALARPRSIHRAVARARCARGTLIPKALRRQVTCSRAPVVLPDDLDTRTPELRVTLVVRNRWTEIHDARELFPVQPCYALRIQSLPRHAVPRQLPGRQPFRQPLFCQHHPTRGLLLRHQGVMQPDPVDSARCIVSLGHGLPCGLVRSVRASKPPRPAAYFRRVVASQPCSSAPRQRRARARPTAPVRRLFRAHSDTGRRSLRRRALT